MNQTRSPSRQRTGQDSDGLELAVPARPENVSAVRRAVMSYARTRGLDEDAVADIALAVGEACANVVVHGYRGGADAPTLEVRVRGRDGGRLVVVVADRGVGLAPRTDSPGLGLGLPLMASVTESLELRQAAGGGTEVWMTFAAQAEAIDQRGRIRFGRTA